MNPPVLPKNVVPKPGESFEINLRIESPLRMEVKLPRCDLAARVGLLRFGGEEMVPNFFEGDLGLAGKLSRCAHGVKMNEDVPEIEDDGSDHSRL